MRDFFKGGKRKVGRMSLGLACVFAAGWVRSQISVDVMTLPFKYPAPGSRAAYD